MKLFLLFFVCLFSACTTSHSHLVKLEHGEKLVCKKVSVEPCGMSLAGCGDKQSVEFECAKGVLYIGPGEYLEPDIIDEPASPTPAVSVEATKVPAKKGKK